MKGNFKCCWKRRLFETCPISTPWSRKNRLGKCNLWQLTTTCRNRHILKGMVSFGEAVSYNSFLIITGDGFCTYIVLKLSNHPFEISGIEKDTFTNILRKSKYALPTRFLLSESRSGNVDTFDEIFSDLSDSSSTDSTCFIHVLHLPVNVIFSELHYLIITLCFVKSYFLGGHVTTINFFVYNRV